MTEPKTYSAKQVATRIGTDARQLRKFLRDPNTKYKAVGQGARYDFPETDLPQIKAEFDIWNSGKAKRNRSSASTGVPRAPRIKSDAPTPKERRRAAEALAEAGLTGTALDDDDIRTRATTSIRERAKAHGLTVKQGRWVPIPEQKGTTAVMDDDYSGPHNEMQPIVDAMEAGYEVDDFDSLYEDQDFDGE